MVCLLRGYYIKFFCLCGRYKRRLFWGGVTLSEPFGVVEGTSLVLTVTPKASDHKIYYTKNGTPATTLFAQGVDSEGLFLYDGDCIYIEESKNPADYALTPNVVYDPNLVGLYTFGYVSKGVPLSLVEVNADGEIVVESTGTYIFHSDGKAHFGNVPVVCLSAPVDDWIGADKTSGVYNTLSKEPMLRAWLEYYDYGTKEKFCLNTQIKLGGNATRNFPVRTLIANFKKNENDEKNPKPKVNIFKDRVALGTSKPILGQVSRFRIYSGGNNACYSFFDDAFIHRVVSLFPTNVATSAYRPCVLYLNGEYWGVYGLREHYNEDYIEYTFGVDCDDVVYVDKCYNPEPEISKYSYNVKTSDLELCFSVLDELHNFLEITENSDGTYTFGNEKDWTTAEVYNEFCRLVDIDSLIDSILIRGYIGDFDFIWNNFRMWRVVPNPQKNKTKNTKYADGKWRFMIHDTDFGLFEPTTTLSLCEEDRNSGKNIFDFYLGNAKNTENFGFSPLDHRIISLPAKNEAFKARLWERAHYIQNTVFAAQNATVVLDAMQAEIEPLYAEKIERWALTGYSMQVWKEAVEVHRKFLYDRPAYFLDNIRTAFGIESD